MNFDKPPAVIVLQSAIIHPDWDLVTHHAYLVHEEFVDCTLDQVQTWLDAARTAIAET
jgi:hypothetical protein